MSYHSNFILFSEDKSLVAWNYVDHIQYRLSLAHAARYIELIYNPEAYNSDSSIDTDLENSSLFQKDGRRDRDWGWDRLSDIFHFGTKNLDTSARPNSDYSWADQYLCHCKTISQTPPPPEENRGSCDHEAIKLPTPSNLETSLQNALRERKTCRDFKDTPVTLEQLSSVLKSTLGISRIESDPAVPENLAIRRFSPSGGGMNATNAYIYIRAVDKLKPGFYQFNRDSESLTLIRESTVKLGELTNGQHFSDNAAFCLFFTSRLDRLWWKYNHSRTYRMALIELGHYSQTALLSITAVGLKSWMTGALDDSTIELNLGINYSPEQLFFCVAAGHGTDSSISQGLRHRLEQK